MTARDWFRVIGKEVRAVAPVWAAATLATAAMKTPSGSSYEYLLRGIGYAAFFVGPSAVGALSFGHEFNFGTWPMLLTLPISRRQLLLAKFGVLAVLLFLFTTVAAWFGPLSGPREMGRYAGAMPVLLGAFVAPWLTLETRRAVGGSVFAVALPGVLLILGQIVGVRMYGYTGEVDVVVARFMFWGMSTACVAGAVLGWRRFMRFEVAEGGSPEQRAAGGTRASERPSKATRVSPVWSLFAKELRLQRLTLAMGAFYALAYTVSVLTMGALMNFDVIAAVLTVVFGSLLSMVAGAVASAEERQLGTLDDQVLLPVALWKQWTIKAATVLGLAVALGYGLPAFLAWTLPPHNQHAHDIAKDIVQPIFAGIVVLFAAISLYVSSICRSTLSALIFAFPVYVSTAVLFREIAAPVTRAVSVWTYGQGGYDARPDDPLVIAVIAVVAALMTALVVRLALSNHRYADRSPVRIAAHAALLVLALAAGLAVLGAVGIH